MGLDTVLPGMVMPSHSGACFPSCTPLSALPTWDGGEADVCENTYFFLLPLLAELTCMFPVCTEGRRVGGVGVKSGQIILVVVGVGGEGMRRLLPRAASGYHQSQSTPPSLTILP